MKMKYIYDTLLRIRLRIARLYMKKPRIICSLALALIMLTSASSGALSATKPAAANLDSQTMQTTLKQYGIVKNSVGDYQLPPTTDRSFSMPFETYKQRYRASLKAGAPMPSDQQLKDRYTLYQAAPIIVQKTFGTTDPAKIFESQARQMSFEEFQSTYGNYLKQTGGKSYSQQQLREIYDANRAQQPAAGNAVNGAR